MIKLYNGDILGVDFQNIPEINLVVTSPVYNVGIKYSDNDDTMTYDDYLKWCKKWLSKIYNHMADDGRMCINIPFSVTPTHLTKEDVSINYPVAADYTKLCQEIGFNYYRTIIWQKMGSNKTCWGSWRSASSPFIIDPNECILVFYKNQWKRKSKGESTITGSEFMKFVKNIWEMRSETNSDHPAPFPIELPNRCIKLFSYKHDWIFDPFLGSGTTGESAAILERNFAGVELSKNYFESAKTRIEDADFQTQNMKRFFPGGNEDVEEMEEPSQFQ